MEKHGLNTIIGISKMYYITLDLEWNQAYAQKALAVQRRLCSRLRGEVIQIGAVKLDKNMRICGSYQIIVKPKYFTKLHKLNLLATLGIHPAWQHLSLPPADKAEIGTVPQLHSNKSVFPA